MAVRLDVWLDVSCLFRTRSEAQKACKGGKVDVNGQSAKPHRELKAGDEILITRPVGRRQRVVVKELADTHVARAKARTFYEDITPPPSPEEVDIRRMEKLARQFLRPASVGSPDKRERRHLRKMKRGE